MKPGVRGPLSERAIEGNPIERELRRIRFGSLRRGACVYGIRLVVHHDNLAVLVFEPEIDSSPDQRAIDVDDEVPLPAGSGGSGGLRAEVALNEHVGKAVRLF